jgi:hypothetical protein
LLIPDQRADRVLLYSYRKPNSGKQQKLLEERKTGGVKKYGNLTILFKVAGEKTTFRCRCKCGKLVNILRASIVSGNSRSCGCLHRAGLVKRNTIHGFAKRGTKLPAELLAYYNAKDRCTRKKNKSYGSYGGRGIRFKFKSFQEFMEALRTPENPSGLKPSAAYSLDRIDNSRGYGFYAGVSNIRWATKRQQMLNRRGWAKK